MPDITIHSSEQQTDSGFYTTFSITVDHLTYTRSAIVRTKGDSAKQQTMYHKSLGDTVKSILALLDELDR